MFEDNAEPSNDWCGGQQKGHVHQRVKGWCPNAAPHSAHWRGDTPQVRSEAEEGLVQESHPVGTKSLCTNCGEMIQFVQYPHRDDIRWTHMDSDTGLQLGHWCSIQTTRMSARPSSILLTPSDQAKPEKDENDPGRMIIFREIIEPNVFQAEPTARVVIKSLAVRARLIDKVETSTYGATYLFVPHPHQLEPDSYAKVGSRVRYRHRYWKADSTTGCLIITLSDGKTHMVEVEPFDQLIDIIMHKERDIHG